jgi:hypothetical protein
MVYCDRQSGRLGQLGLGRYVKLDEGSTLRDHTFLIPKQYDKVIINSYGFLMNLQELCPPNV